MPRCARLKSPESIYHVMCRSISEISLFQDEDDKKYYLELLVRYKERYKCSIYAYCLMTSHLHLHFDPKGADVSKFMHCTNTAYVRYYNRKYKRHGHLFQDRFTSKILSSEAYNLAVSAYIHNNPHNIGEYSGKEELYEYSSYGIYLGIRKDIHKVIDKSFIFELFGGNEKNFVKKYLEFAIHHRDIGCIKKSIKEIEERTKNEYRSERKTILRNHVPSKVIAYISDRVIGKSKKGISLKRQQKEYRALCAYALRLLCGLMYREICGYLYNITLSGCSIMCDRGYELSIKRKRCKGIIEELIKVGLVA